MSKVIAAIVGLTNTIEIFDTWVRRLLKAYVDSRTFRTRQDRDEYMREYKELNDALKDAIEKRDRVKVRLIRHRLVELDGGRMQEPLSKQS